MGVEIERKFLVVGDDWRSSPGVEYRQGYLSGKPPVVRVRTMGELAALTIKGASEGLSRAEFEYPIPHEDAVALLGMCIGPLIEKTRYTLDWGGHTWEVDEFFGDNAGLIVAEVELDSEDVHVDLPDWVGEEVSHDPRYFNSNLSREPFATWAQQ